MGYIAVDGFLALTGFLSMWSILTSAHSTAILYGSTSSFFRAWWEWMRRRWWRIMPALLLNLAIHCTLFAKGTFPLAYVRNVDTRAMLARMMVDEEDPYIAAGMCSGLCNAAWGPLLHVANYMPWGGTQIWLWSLSVQFSVYLWVPLVARVAQAQHFRRLLAACAALYALHALVLTVGNVQLAHAGDGALFKDFLQFFYYANTWCRLPPVLAGALLGWLAACWQAQRGQCKGAAILKVGGSTRLAAVSLVQEWVASTPAKLALAAVALPSLAYTAVRSFGSGHAYSLVEALCLNAGSIGAAVTWAVILAFVLLPGAWPAWVHARLQTPWLLHLANFTYEAYLVHPVVFQLLLSSPYLMMPASEVPIPAPQPVLKAGVSTLWQYDVWFTGGSSLTSTPDMANDTLVAEPTLAQGSRISQAVVHAWREPPAWQAAMKAGQAHFTPWAPVQSLPSADQGDSAQLRYWTCCLLACVCVYLLARCVAAAAGAIKRAAAWPGVRWVAHAVVLLHCLACAVLSIAVNVLGTAVVQLLARPDIMERGAVGVLW